MLATAIVNVGLGLVIARTRGCSWSRSRSCVIAVVSSIEFHDKAEHVAFGESDRSLLRSPAGRMSMVLENARLYHRLDGLFRTYMSPDVATALLADPARPGWVVPYGRSAC